MHAQEHSVVREGIVTGMIGALIVAIWYFVFDAAGGRPLYTPNVIGKILFHGDLTPGTTTIMPSVLLGYTLVHFVLFALVGMGLTLLVHQATRNTTLRMGVWLGLVVAFCFFAGMTFMLTTASGNRLPLWSVIGGSLLGVLAMAWYLWRRHPRLRSSFEESALGAEVKPPPHPPGGPRI
jgi:hypothetical protein